MTSRLLAMLPVLLICCCITVSNGLYSNYVNNDAKNIKDLLQNERGYYIGKVNQNSSFNNSGSVIIMQARKLLTKGPDIELKKKSMGITQNKSLRYKTESKVSKNVISTKSSMRRNTSSKVITKENDVISENKSHNSTSRSKRSLFLKKILLKFFDLDKKEEKKEKTEDEDYRPPYPSYYQPSIFPIQPIMMSYMPSMHIPFFMPSVTLAPSKVPAPYVYHQHNHYYHRSHPASVMQGYQPSMQGYQHPVQSQQYQPIPPMQIPPIPPNQRPPIPPISPLQFYVSSNHAPLSAIDSKQQMMQTSSDSYAEASVFQRPNDGQQFYIHQR